MQTLCGSNGSFPSRPCVCTCACLYVCLYPCLYVFLTQICTFAFYYYCEHGLLAVANLGSIKRTISDVMKFTAEQILLLDISRKPTVRREPLHCCMVHILRFPLGQQYMYAHECRIPCRGVCQWCPPSDICRCWFVSIHPNSYRHHFAHCFNKYNWIYERGL